MWKFLVSSLFAGFFLTTAAASEPSLESELAAIQQEWAIIKYRTPEKQRVDAFAALANKARDLSFRHPQRAEPLIWEGIVVASLAGAKGGLGALKLVKRARDRLLAAEKIDPGALDGSIYTSLGSLYYKVPGWPIGFGDDKKAREYLEMARSLNPDGIDPNFFYGEFLMEQGEYSKAAEILRHALAAPNRPGRALADEGRRAEVQILLAKVQAHLK